MPPTDAPELPDVAAIIAQVLQRVTPERQPLLVAFAERLAAERYRSWAADPANQAFAPRLLACATREEEIATRVESLSPEAASIQRELQREHPDLEEINRTLFAGRPLMHQFTMQARGERIGAAFWRAAARLEDRPDARQTLLRCAELEEENAVVLEAIRERASPDVR